MIFDLFILSAIIVFIVDVSGVIDTIKNIIWKWVFNGKREYREFRLKPFDCSLCMTFWIGLIWITINGFTLFNLLSVCLFAMMSEEIAQILLTIKYLIHRLIDWCRFENYK